MPNAVESGRVKLEGLFNFYVHPFWVGQLRFGFPRTRLLQGPTSRTTGRLGLPPLPNNTRLA